jgi:hypothetical protein
MHDLLVPVVGTRITKTSIEAWMDTFESIWIHFRETTCSEGRGQSLFRSRQQPERKGRACLTQQGSHDLCDNEFSRLEYE